MTKKQISRRNQIIRQLANLSRDGWNNAMPSDYLPLEAELRRIEHQG
jgi:hypothetical protein